MQRFYWNDDWYLTEKQDGELVKYEDAEKEIAALKENVEGLKKEISNALDVLNPSMRSSGLVDACRQRAQAYISERDNCEECEKMLAEISDFLSTCFAPVSGRHLELMNKIDKMLAK